MDDIYPEILSNLDAKSVCKFKLVSKEWCFSISDPSFSKLYYLKRPFITGFFYRTSQNYPEKIQFVPLDPNQEPIVDPTSSLGFLDNPAILCNSCNGLLHWHTSRQKQHFISNPLIQKSVPLTWPFSRRDFVASGLVFEPSGPEHFQVVVLYKETTESGVGIKSRIFSSETLEWGAANEALIVPGTNAAPFSRHRGQFLNGVLYWELKDRKLLAYNVEERTDSLIELPSSILPGNVNFAEPGCLGVSKSDGKLRYCRVINEMIFVWAEEEDHSSWKVGQFVDLNVILRGNPSVQPQGTEALAFVDDDCKKVLLGAKQKILAYKVGDESAEEVCGVRRSGDPTPRVKPSMFFPFAHTLALMNLRITR